MQLYRCGIRKQEVKPFKITTFSASESWGLQ